MATFNDPGNLPIFPGFQHFGVVSPQVQEIVVEFNARYLDALNRAPMMYVKPADLGTFVMQGWFESKVPMQLPGSLAFQPFDGTRRYQELFLAAPLVKSSPFELNFEWPFVIEQGNATLKNYYGPSRLASAYVDAGRAHKARMLGDLLRVAYGTSAQALTIPQPGFPNGLPLFTDGSVTASHFSHPFRADSARFNNLFLTAGKFDTDNLITTQANMANVAHPTIPNLPAGYQVKHIVGPTWMRKPFYQVALQNLQLQIKSSAFAATTNIGALDKLKELGESSFIGASGVGPVTYHIFPELDAHPIVAGVNQGKDFWMAIDDSAESAPWANFLAPNVDFTPLVRLLGDGSEEAIKSGMIRLYGDLHAGVGAGWPGSVAMYFEG